MSNAMETLAAIVEGEIERLRTDIESYIKIGSELATDNERLSAINAELVAAGEEALAALYRARGWLGNIVNIQHAMDLLDAAIARAKP